MVTGTSHNQMPALYTNYQIMNSHFIQTE
jgi:hypothetical protein